MRPIPVLVVGETPSLGRAVADLLDSEGISHRLVYDVRSDGPTEHVADRYTAVIVACNEQYCVTARLRARGGVPGVALVIVGSRDPILSKLSGVRVIPLPLRPGPFLAEVNSLLARTAPVPR